MSNKDRANLLAIIDSCQKIQSFVSDIKDSDEFYNDQRSFDAVMMNFIVIGESVSRLSETLKENYTSIPWIKIKGFRNLVAHDYFGIDAEEVWQIIQNDIPQLEVAINKITS